MRIQVLGNNLSFTFICLVVVVVDAVVISIVATTAVIIVITVIFVYFSHSFFHALLPSLALSIAICHKVNVHIAYSLL